MRALTKKNLLILGSILLTFAIVKILITVGIINSFYEITIATIAINIILAVSLNLVTGFTGQFSLGHAGFMSIGAYVCAIISMHMNSTLGFLIGTIAGAIAATIVGILVGIPTLRLKGDYLAIATLGMAEIIRVLFLNMDITNGAAGLNGIPRFTNWTWLFFFTVGSIVLINNFIIKPDLFRFLKSIDILVSVVLGGMGSLTGSVIAAVALALITTFLQSFTAVRMILYAALLVVIMIFRPQGIMGTKEINDLFQFKSRKKDERIE